MLNEGLATMLQGFNDLSRLRDPGLTSQKYCILICNSPPYNIPVMDVPNFQGIQLEQLALAVKENNIQLSIISPRRIPTWVNSGQITMIDPFFVIQLINFCNFFKCLVEPV